jgi:ribosomal protein S18 acetylase RimI-like enzyme
MSLLIRKTNPSDVLAIADIHRTTFPRQTNSIAWVSATIAAEPRMFVFVAELESTPIGYIFWAQKSGIRPAAVVELDQIAILPTFRGKGFAESLIRESLALVMFELEKNNQTLKSVLISTRSDNQAQHLYKKVLGAKVVATIEDLYSAAEVLMVAEVKNA